MTKRERDIVLPELGAEHSHVQISSWLVDLQEDVVEGDRIVEVRLPGITFDLNAPADGKLVQILKTSGAVIKTGDILGKLLLSMPDDDSVANDDE